jgi:hypothetical protein
MRNNRKKAIENAKKDDSPKKINNSSPTKTASKMKNIDSPVKKQMT